MEIKILGKNSSNRIKILKHLERSLKNIGINSIDITMIEDDSEIQKYHVSNTPSIVINEKVVSEGKILTERELKNYIKILT